MPIASTRLATNPIAEGALWVPENLPLLAQLVARVSLGQSRHVAKILAGVGIPMKDVDETVRKSAIKRLTLAESDSDPYQRDGWIFQVISWIACLIEDSSAIVSAPHMELAQKGFDGLQIKLTTDGLAVERAVIFEDKATEDARATITNKVWPEFRAFERGERDSSLVAQVVALLESKSTLDVDTAIAAVMWSKARAYRVFVTSPQVPGLNAAGEPSLFLGFDGIVGRADSRFAHTFVVSDMRAWMTSLAGLSINYIIDTDEGSADV